MKKIRVIMEISREMTEEEFKAGSELVESNYGMSLEEAIKQTAYEEAVKPNVDPEHEEYSITVEVEDIENSPAE